MKIAVIGTGYVGLVSGTCFAETGNNVICVDIDAKKVEKMQNGEVPIYEPGLNLLFERNTEEGRLSFTTNLEEGTREAEIIFLALPTPPDEDGSADLKYILEVAHELGKLITDYKVIVDKSTVPVGTTEKVAKKLSENADRNLFDVVSNPEFLREGVAVDDFLKPDRVVIGTTSERAKDIMLRLYKPFVRQGNPIIFMDERSAEMTKYAANSFLATKITFMNEIANLCEKVGANVDQVRIGIGSDTRIGKRFLFPGIGYGGSCFPKDVQALEKIATENSYDFEILKSVMKINYKQKLRLINKLKAFYDNAIEGKTFAIWGLSFKPNTDDIREAPVLYIIKELLEQNCRIKVWDPEAMENVKAQYPELEYCHTQYEAIKAVDALLICTEWSVFRTPDFDKMKTMMNTPVIFDGRNLYDLDQMKEKNFHYESIGRPQISRSQ